MDDNGNGNFRNHFGTREWEDLHPEIADRILILFKQKNPAQFGRYLAEALELTKESQG